MVIVCNILKTYQRIGFISSTPVTKQSNSGIIKNSKLRGICDKKKCVNEYVLNLDSINLSDIANNNCKCLTFNKIQYCMQLRVKSKVVIPTIVDLGIVAVNRADLRMNPFLQVSIANISSTFASHGEVISKIFNIRSSNSIL